MIYNFQKWLEHNQIQNLLHQQQQHPASSEVLRTGKQPQVDSKILENIDQEKLMAIDSHIERIKVVVQDFEPKSKQGYQAKQMLNGLISEWDNLIKVQPPSDVPNEFGNALPQRPNPQDGVDTIGSPF